MTREAPKDVRELASSKEEPTLGSPLKSYAYRPYLQGSSISFDPEGRSLHVLDPDAGSLTVIDIATQARRTAQVCDGPEQVVVAPGGSAFVSCRGSGEVVALEPDLGVRARRAVGAEPFGLALAMEPAPTVFVTVSGEPRVAALDASDLSERWRASVAPQPRGVAVSADGQQLVVAHLLDRNVTVIENGSAFHAKLPRERDGWPSELLEDFTFENLPKRIPGGAYAVAMSPGGTRAFVPYALRNNGEGIESFIAGCYANGLNLPLAPSVAAVDVNRREVLRPQLKTIQQESGRDLFHHLGLMGKLGVIRGAVHDPKRSRLFAVGESSGLLLALDTSRADPTSTMLASWQLGGPARGVAVDASGDRAYVHLWLDHKVEVVDTKQADTTITSFTVGQETLPATLAKGRKLFHSANDGRVAGITGVACTSCHMEGRSDGVTWLLDGKPLSTPMLAGRLDHAGPFRWAGESPNLAHAVGESIRRLQGSGLSQDEVSAIVGYLRSSAAEMKPVASARHAPEDGSEIFARAGCGSCHVPSQAFSDAQVHPVRGAGFRTPSLRGLSLTAPYYHDGKANDLVRMLSETASDDNPMALGGRFDKAAIDTLAAYLLSL